MLGSAQKDLPCFKVGGVKQAVKEIRERLAPAISNKGECMAFADQLIVSSYDNWRTHAYDQV
jgi:uncharacterized protein YktB (UPF0637 family)